MRKKHLVIFVVLLALIYAVFSLKNEITYSKYIKIGENVFSIIVVDSEEERNKGLSGTLSLAKHEAMLFIFEEPAKYSFWMKDMNFPIDIIWIDEYLNVVHIEENLSPKSYPKSFSPEEESLYVIEVNAGIVEKDNINVGDSVFMKYSI